MWCSWGFSSDFAEKMVEMMMRNVPVGGWGRGVCMCVVLTEKEKEKENKNERWPAKERKEGVDCVMGSGVRWGACENQNNLILSIFFFFLTDGTLQYSFSCHLSWHMLIFTRLLSLMLWSKSLSYFHLGFFPP